MYVDVLNKIYLSKDTELRMRSMESQTKRTSPFVQRFPNYFGRNCQRIMVGTNCTLKLFLQ